MFYLEIDSNVETAKPICRIEGGKYDKKIIYVVRKENTEISESSSDSSDDLDDLKKRIKKTENMNIDEMAKELMSEILFNELKEQATNNKVRQRNEELKTLLSAFIRNKESFKDDRLNSVYQISKKKFEERKAKEINIKDGKLQQLPSVDDQHRLIAYVAGPEGSGKTTYVKDLIKSYNALYPRNKIILISQVEEDETLKDVCKKIIQIEISEDLLDDKIDIKKELKNSLVIFDDTDQIPNKKLNAYINEELLNNIIQNGRHQNIQLIKTSHLISDYKKSRLILASAHTITGFLATSAMQLNYVMKEYIGLTPIERKEVMKKSKNSNWVTIHKRMPQYVMTEHSVFLL